MRLATLRLAEDGKNKAHETCEQYDRCNGDTHRAVHGIFIKNIGVFTAAAGHEQETCNHYGCPDPHPQGVFATKNWLAVERDVLFFRGCSGNPVTFHTRAR